MKAISKLPEGYIEIGAIDLQKDKKLMLLVNGLSLVIGGVVALLGHFLVPYSVFFATTSIHAGLWTLAFVVAYIFLHEVVHGIAMKLVGTKKVKYGFTGMYAFAGSDDFYDKKAYIFIAMAPVVFWGIILAVLCAVVPLAWFWPVFFIQIVNISGATGDFYVTFKFASLPDDIFVQDYGVGMMVYSKVPKK